MILKFHGTKLCQIVKKWEKCEKKLSTKVSIARTINFSQEVLEIIDIHVFGDASFLGTCAVAHSHTTTIWNQTRSNSKQIKIVKEAINNTTTRISSSTDDSKFSKKHSKLFANYSIRSVCGWSHGTVVLH